MAAAGEAMGPQASVTTEGPVGRSVVEDTRPVEEGSMGQERREAARPDEEEATASSPPMAEPREERQVMRSPTPLRQVSPPECEETANTETAESGTLAEPTTEMDVEAAATPAGQDTAEPHGPALDAREEENAPQGSNAHIHTPARSPQASGGNGPREGLELEAGSVPSQAPRTLACGGSSLSRARRSSAFRYARSALDGLEPQLALEEAELSNVRAELERARVWLLKTV